MVRWRVGPTHRDVPDVMELLVLWQHKRPLAFDEPARNRLVDCIAMLGGQRVHLRLRVELEVKLIRGRRQLDVVVRVLVHDVSLHHGRSAVRHDAFPADISRRLEQRAARLAFLTAGLIETRPHPG
eukprot:5271881-Prymnesium_polylepis.2